MRFEKYVHMAMATSGTQDKSTLLANATFGLFGETGEVVDAVKKYAFQHHPLDKGKLVEELGDCMWYVAAAMQALEIDANSFEYLLEGVPEEVAEEFGTAGESLYDSVFRLAARAGQFVQAMHEWKGGTNHYGYEPDIEGCFYLMDYIIAAGILCQHLGTTLPDVMLGNIEKLSKRYPKGTFRAEDSLNRVN